jgi:hypothetical protein
LQTGDEQLAHLHSGAGPKMRRACVEMLAARGNLREADRSGRPTAYTDDILQRAYQTLLEWEEGFPTATSLVHRLIEEEVLAENADVATFLGHLKGHVKKFGYKLSPNSTQHIFFLKQTDYKDRVTFAHAMQTELETTALENVIFVDETTLEESPHPKSKRV